MSLAIFDLDNTLLGGDSDYLWGRFLVEQGLVDGEYYERENQRFYDQYQAGTLDIHEFLAFMLRPLAENSPTELLNWRTRFIDTKIRPILLPRAAELVARHRGAGDTLLIVTATNRFITEPIAELLSVPHLLATEPEFAEGRYTGHPRGIPCFQHGKVQRLDEWLDATGHDLTNSWFYSDSHNDLPLLDRVVHPVAVDPDPVLAEHARRRGWPIISLRGD
ncbi:MAG: HAD-IB family hydrolase [Candidatus Contendobacter sp.]|nr:HAD-IB family hydrolase [Candidatus Contendobacter sp.]MDG4558254.1 HAD-IB family hydrolase [Candidatus Contendobacter sp.]